MCEHSDLYVMEIQYRGNGQKDYIVLDRATATWDFTMQKDNAFIFYGDQGRDVARAYYDERVHSDISQVCMGCDCVSWTRNLS